MAFPDVSWKETSGGISQVFPSLQDLVSLGGGKLEFAIRESRSETGRIFASADSDPATGNFSVSPSLKIRGIRILSSPPERFLWSRYRLCPPSEGRCETQRAAVPGGWRPFLFLCSGPRKSPVLLRPSEWKPGNTGTCSPRCSPGPACRKEPARFGPRRCYAGKRGSLEGGFIGGWRWLATRQPRLVRHRPNGTDNGGYWRSNWANNRRGYNRRLPQGGNWSSRTIAKRRADGFVLPPLGLPVVESRFWHPQCAVRPLDTDRESFPVRGPHCPAGWVWVDRWVGELAGKEVPARVWIPGVGERMRVGVGWVFVVPTRGWGYCLPK